MAFEHDGFWQPMDTLRDKNLLEELWAVGQGALEDLVSVRPDATSGAASASSSPATPASRALARALAAAAGRRGRRAIALAPPTDAEPVRRCSASATRMARPRRRHPRRGRDARPCAGGAAARSCSTWPRSRWCARAIATRSRPSRPTSWARRNVLEAVRARRRRARRGRRHHRQGLREPRMGVALPRDRPARRPRSLQRQQGAAEIVVASLSRLLPRRTRASRVAIGAGRQRDRRRRLGGGPADPRLPCAPGAPAQPLRSARPQAVRPWQHVLEPLSGYLRLAERLWQRRQRSPSAWNFGPETHEAATVERRDPAGARGLRPRRDRMAATAPTSPHEAGCSRSTVAKARARARLAAALDARRGAATHDRLVSHGTPSGAAPTRMRRRHRRLRDPRVTEPDASAMSRVRHRRHAACRASSADRAPAPSATHAASCRGCSARRSWPPPAGGAAIAQINHTLTRQRGTVRGLHFQHPPHAEMKLVSCLRGEVFDVAVDLRAGSPTLPAWHARSTLRRTTAAALLIPEGFAHGFQTLADDCELLYLHSAAYQPASRRRRSTRATRGWRSPGRCRSPTLRRATRRIRC